MFSTKASLEERVASTSSSITFIDVNDFLTSIGVCSALFPVNVYPLTTIHTVSYGGCNRNLEDMGPVERVFCKVYPDTDLDWFIR